jgi:hypothetical protein
MNKTVPHMAQHKVWLRDFIENNLNPEIVKSITRLTFYMNYKANLMV